MRWGAVVIATGALLPWLISIGWAIHAADEFHRRTLLVGTALAFAGAVLAGCAEEMMLRASLIAEPVGMLGIPIAFGFWLLGIIAAHLYFRSRG